MPFYIFEQNKNVKIWNVNVNLLYSVNIQQHSCNMTQYWCVFPWTKNKWAGEEKFNNVYVLKQHLTFHLQVNYSSLQIFVMKITPENFTCVFSYIWPLIISQSQKDFLSPAPGWTDSVSAHQSYQLFSSGRSYTDTWALTLYTSWCSWTQHWFQVRDEQVR